MWRVTQFTIGVFCVDLAVGLVLTIGPGRLLLGLIPHARGTVRHVIELVAGVVLLVVAVALWRGRRSLARRELPMRSGGGGSALSDRRRVDRCGRAADRRALFRGDRGDRGVERKLASGDLAADPVQRLFRAAAVGDHRGPLRPGTAPTHGSRRPERGCNVAGRWCSQPCFCWSAAPWPCSAAPAWSSSSGNQRRPVPRLLLSRSR